VLAVSQLLLELGSYSRYGDALHDTALSAISGEPLGRPDALARVVEVLLAAYSVAVFATLVGTVGAYLLRTDQPARAAQEPSR
jgi:voltage-gated potassium channel